MIERKAFIFNVQKYNMYDGPGVRTMVFFQGCPLRCEWCSNPESQSREYQIMCKQDACARHGACVTACPMDIHKLSADGREHFIDRTIECTGCRYCEQACPASALAINGEMRTISELVDIVAEDMPFYSTSGGGLTLGGGEPLMQPEAAANLLMACQQRGINTAVETCGYARPETLLKVAEFTDLFLFDVKHMDSARHHEMTGVHNETILGNLRLLLDNRHDVRLRLPLLRGYNDGDDALLPLIDFLEPYRECRNFKGVDLLPYHKMGVHKYAQLDRDYRITGNPVPSDTDLARIEEHFKRRDIPVATIHH